MKKFKREQQQFQSDPAKYQNEKATTTSDDDGRARPSDEERSQATEEYKWERTGENKNTKENESNETVMKRSAYVRTWTELEHWTDRYIS